MVMMQRRQLKEKDDDEQDPLSHCGKLALVLSLAGVRAPKLAGDCPSMLSYGPSLVWRAAALILLALARTTQTARPRCWCRR